MGPFSNNIPPSSPPPSNGNKLPVPDVNGTPPDIFVSPGPDNSLATKKWFTITMIIAGIMAAAGLVTFIIYVIVSNTPGYILNAAMQNLVQSDGEAGTVRYEIQQGKTTRTVTGDFLTYTDPTNRAISTLTISAGQSDSRVSGTVRLFPDSNYFQSAGLGNIGRLVSSAQGGSPTVTTDQSTRLSGLDGQWHSLTGDDIFDLRAVLPPQVTGSPTSGDIETLRQLYLKHPFIMSTQPLGDEQIEGINTMHLRVGFDQPKLSAFLANVKAANIKSLRLSDDDIKALQNGQAFGLNKATIEVWINRSDRTFRQLRLAYPEHTLTITLHSEQVATQRQSVLRPENTKSATVFVRGLQDILKSSAAAAR